MSACLVITRVDCNGVLLVYIDSASYFTGAQAASHQQTDCLSPHIRISSLYVMLILLSMF